METRLSSAGVLRWSLALLLLAAAAMFVIGVSIERSQSDVHGSNEAGEEHPGLTEGADEHQGETGAEAAQEGKERTSEELFGINMESIPVIITAVISSAVLALAVLAIRSPVVLVIVALVGFAAMAFDIREAVHQADESRTAVVALASITGALHLAVGLLAAATAWSQDSVPGRRPA